MERMVRRRLTTVALVAAALTLSTPAIGAARPAPATSRPTVAPPTLAQEMARTASVPRASAPQRVPAQGPLVWGAPVGIDSNPIDGLACPSISLCIAIDNHGRVLSSTDPTGGASRWKSTDVDGRTSLIAISCPSASVCVVVDGDGNAVTTGDPPGPASAWTVALVDSSITEPGPYGGGPDLLRGVSCPSVSFCVAADSVGNIVYSGNPTGGLGAWTLIHVDDNSDYQCTGGGLTCQAPLMGVSCPTAALCTAVDFTGNILQTTAPAGLQAWPSRPSGGGGPQSLWSVSCPTTSLCATVNGTSGDDVTWNPVAGSRLTTHRLSIDAFGIWCSTASLCLASGESANGTAELVGSTDPAAKSPVWDVTEFGGITAVSCPTKSVCLGADDEGQLIVGVTVTSLATTLRREALGGRIRRIAVLVRRRGYALRFTSPLAGQLGVEWKSRGAAGAAVLATASARFTGRQTRTVRLELTAAGTRLLKSRSRVSVTAAATYQTNTGAVVARRTLALRSRG